MSHFTTIETEIRDLEALRAACGELGLTLQKDGEARGYAGDTIKAAHVIKLKGPYDIAVNQEKNGTYTLVADRWGGHVDKEAGKGYAKLLQFYGVHKTVREARRKGCLVQRKTEADGSIKLILAGAV